MPTDESSEQEMGEREEREALDRAFASNDKVQFDNLISHEKGMMSYGELALKQAVEFQQKANDLYLNQMDAREKQRLGHDDELFKNSKENNRYTLNSLYGISSEEEAVSLAVVLDELKEVIKEKE